jgi:phosphoribosylaminoimidazole-succinocarboxamide synthase
MLWAFSQNQACKSLMAQLGDWPLVYQGKVRDVYRINAEELLLVATDRVSAFDWVLPTEIPGKGKILNQLSVWWFEQLAPLVPNHVVSLAVPQEVAGRAMVVRQLEMLPIEAVVRGYLTGSGWLDYQATGEVSGLSLPSGLSDGDRLPDSLFTPATKAPKGEHDQTINFAKAEEVLGESEAEQMRELSLKLYDRANELVTRAGFVVADTKFEFGTLKDKPGVLVLGDEVLTPDSSRYWLAEQLATGARPESFDKQIIRDWLISPASGWSKESTVPPPQLPDQVVDQTRARYLEVFERLTGRLPK